MNSDDAKSHSQKYADAKQRHIDSKKLLAEFSALKDFPLDAFQVDSCKSLESGVSVLVAAPTGSGKTIVGEFAIFLAQKANLKAFYTTPIKALSNQKFHELQEVYGEEKVGLLTGDVSINGDADIVVMTTEVLRNMLYVKSSTLNRLSHVVMDEVHYLADRSRGAVWEEVMLHLPESVQITALSATVSNVEEFGAWISSIRGETAVVLEEHRPVPLWQFVAADNEIHDLYMNEIGSKVNPSLINLYRDDLRQLKGVRGRQRYSRHTPQRERLINKMQKQNLLPAIWFIFSRKGCDAAVEQCVRSNLRLTSPSEQSFIRETVLERTKDLPGEDLAALEFGNWLDALERGFASHHAGLIPRFKEIVEELFQQSLIKVVFATETLALGINMPAKSVVIEKLTKWNGETHVALSAGEYTQLTGRAGRRGIDDEGNSIVLWHENFDPVLLGGLASTRTYPLKSSFRPGYNMAVNVIDVMGYQRTQNLINESFAQFQADKNSASLLISKRKNEEALGGYLEAMQCHLGDFLEYSQIRDEIANLEKGGSKSRKLSISADNESLLSELQVGDVVLSQQGRRSGPLVVIDQYLAGDGSSRIVVMNLHKEVRKLGAADFSDDIEQLGKIRLPANFHSRSNKSKVELLGSLKKVNIANKNPRKSGKRGEDLEIKIQTLRISMRQHPCHGCSDREEHARWSERYLKLLRDTKKIADQIAHRTGVIAKEFGEVCEILLELDYLQGDLPQLSVTESGKTLKGIHAESSLLIAQSLKKGFLEGLNPAELASTVSVFVYESRRDEHENQHIRNPLVQNSFYNISKEYQELFIFENTRKLNTLMKPDPGFANLIYAWASGNNLLQVLRRTEISAGDFVRTTRRIIDVLEQIAHVANGDLKQNAQESILLLRRGIVSASELED